MSTSRLVRLAALLSPCLVALAVPAAAQATREGAGAPDASAATKKDPSTNPADKAFINAFRDGMVGMHKSMPTGDTDGDFARLVIPQDTATLEMAKAELVYGEDPGLKAIAQGIVDARGKEMAAIKAWQDKHPGH